MRARVFVLLALLASPAAAQDTNYWNIQYGTRATLLGGAVIGSVSDLSATYYNPGAVALFEDPRFILTAKIYEQNSLTVENAAGPGADLTSSSISPSPSFVAAALRFRWLQGNKVAISILTRQRMNTDATTRRIATFDVLPTNPGDEDFAGGISIGQEVEEDWVGVTWARAIGTRVGVGVTPYVAYRHEKWRRETLIQVLQSGGGDLASSTNIRTFEFQNYRMLAKFGVGVDLRPATFGATVTTPGANVAGTGSRGYHSFVNGFDLDGNGTPDSYFASNYQDDVSSTYHSPWSVGIGGSYDFGKIVVHASAEWFAAVDQFDVLETVPFTVQSTGQVVTNALTLELRSVTNFGIGVDYRLGETVVSGGVITDKSAFEPGTATNIALSRWDLIHISGGATFNVAGSEIALGVSYAFGSEDVPQPVALALPNGTLAVGNGEIYNFRERRIKFLFGFNF
jgi:hypothetical protein